MVGVNEDQEDEKIWKEVLKEEVKEECIRNAHSQGIRIQRPGKDIKMDEKDLLK